MVCHRDIKAEHIMIKNKGGLYDCIIKVGDFKHACMINSPDAHMHGKVSTPFYSSPQVAKNDYTRLCDIWSCGVIMYMLLFGFPKRGTKNYKRYSAVSTNSKNFNFTEHRLDFHPNDWNSCSDGAKNLL